MSRGRFMFALWMALCGPAAGQRAWGVEPSGVETLIAQLQSDDWRSRQDAVDKLVTLGEPALPHLRKLLAPSSTADNEVRSRAASAIARIEQQHKTGASLVTLRLNEVPASRAFAELFRQANGELRTDPPDLLSGKSDKPVSLEVERRPFWEVMQSLCAQAGVEPTTVQHRGRDSGLMLVAAGRTGTGAAAAAARLGTRARAWDDKPIVVAGPLLLRAERLSLVSSVQLKAPRAVVREFHITLSAFAEPKLKVLDYSGVLRLQEVLDENGNSLMPDDGQGVPANAEAFGNGQGGMAGRWELGATLQYPQQNRGRKIAKFKASATLEVQTQGGVVELPLKDAAGNPAPAAASTNVQNTVAGIRMVVKGLDVETNRCEVIVYRDVRDDAEWFRLRSLLFAGEARLVDANGQTVARTPGGFETDDSAETGQLKFRLAFEPERPAGSRGGRRRPNDEEPRRPVPAFPDAAKLVWEFPVEARPLVIPFEFKDLPMP